MNKVKATTIAEFAVAMTIISIISGLLLASLFFINRWTHNYKVVSNKYDMVFEYSTLLKLDMFLSNKTEILGNKLRIIRVSNETITYHFNHKQLVRQMGESMFDTVNIRNQIEIGNNDGTDYYCVKLIAELDTIIIKGYPGFEIKLNNIN